MSEELRTNVTDEDLLLRLTNAEDNFVERKRFSDDREWTRTVVAFANSCPVGFPGILFIGVYDNGSVEHLKGPMNLDSLQKSLAKRIDDIWPPVYVLPKIIRKDGQEVLAVLVPGSPLRPHFAGHSYIRVGSETRKASEDQFNNLILQRNSKAREIQNMIGKPVTWEMFGVREGRGTATVVECNQFFMIVDGGTYKRCFPLDWVVISFDPDERRSHLVIRHA